MDTLDDLHNEVYQILEPHASYATGGYGDDVRHFLPVGFLESLAWLSLYVILPILTGTVSSLLSDFLKREDRRKALHQPEGPRIYLPRRPATRFWDTLLGRSDGGEVEVCPLQQHELDEMIRELHLTARSLSRHLPQAEKLLAAQRELCDVLLANGWPSELARSDSESIVRSTLNLLDKGLKRG